MRFLFLGSLIAIVASLFAQSVRAQSNIDSVRVLVEQMDSDAADCGITTRQIEAAAKSALRYNRIRMTEAESASFIYYINVNVRTSGQLCIAAVNVELYDYQLVNFPRIGPMFGKVVLCEAGFVGSGSRGVSEGVYTGIKEMTDTCLSDVSTNALSALTAN